MVRVLLDKGADPTLRDTLGRTALHFCAVTPGTKSLQALCKAVGDKKRRAALDATDNDNLTPLVRHGVSQRPDRCHRFSPH
jgi:ankyrin repeat protein